MDLEKPLGEWNVVEVDCDGDAITNIVNGVVINKPTGANVARGKIILNKLKGPRSTTTTSRSPL
ncbi:hypothetical protein V5E97_36970 [Singulisphaera sp. Ch08]|uniref:3-keto-disaccharide hydrolase domain-containing protein n=1 Tax=Singulisphaera sp. Ch08 TaxID=3120278 RepID=A0AAU7CF79_9BACT